jgi:hypothetical protein
MSIIVASEEVVEDNCYGPSSYSLIVKFALLRSTSDMSLISVGPPSRSRIPSKYKIWILYPIMHLEGACNNLAIERSTMCSNLTRHEINKKLKRH